MSLFRCLSYIAALAASIIALLAVGTRAEPIKLGGYYEDNAVCGASAWHCLFSFSRIGGTETVLVTHVACWANIEPGPLFRANLGVLLKDGSYSSAREEYLARSYAVSEGNHLHHQIGGAVSFLYRPGQTPVVLMRFASSGFMTGQCRITGQRPAPY